MKEILPSNVTSVKKNSWIFNYIGEQNQDFFMRSKELLFEKVSIKTCQLVFKIFAAPSLADSSFFCGNPGKVRFLFSSALIIQRQQCYTIIIGVR